MKRSQWAKKISDKECYARVAGRNRVNRQRQELTARRMELALNLKNNGYTLKQIQQILGVSRVTIWRYLSGKWHYHFTREVEYRYPPGRYRVKKL